MQGTALGKYSMEQPKISCLLGPEEARAGVGALTTNARLWKDWSFKSA